MPSSTNPPTPPRPRGPACIIGRAVTHAYGIRAIKNRTDILRKHLPNAGVGANYSPHYPSEHRYLGEQVGYHLSRGRHDSAVE